MSTTYISEPRVGQARPTDLEGAEPSFPLGTERGLLTIQANELEEELQPTPEANQVPFFIKINLQKTCI